jgi:hypothetical protein
MSEDIRQLRTGYNTHTQEAMDDCENQAQQQMAYAMGIMKLKRDLSNNPKATLDEFINPHLFSGRNQAFFSASIIWTRACSLVLLQVRPQFFSASFLCMQP